MSGRILVGILLIVLGGLFLMDEADVLDFGDVVSNWWPLVLVAIGLSHLVRMPRNPVAAAIFIVLGGIFLASNLYDLSLWSVIWPLAIIAVGVWLIFKRERPMPTSSADTVDLSATFAGLETASVSQNFKGGSLSAICGGLSLNLHQARVAPEGATLHVTALMGGVEIQVPRSWRVVVDGSPLLGGLENSAVTEPGNENAPPLIIKASILMGGAEINNKG